MSWGILLLYLSDGLHLISEQREDSYHFLVFTDLFGNRTHGVVVQYYRPVQVQHSLSPKRHPEFFCFSLVLCPISPIRMGLCKMDTGGIHQSHVSLPHMLCASSPNSPTTMHWRTVYHGGHLYYINSVGLNRGSTRSYKSHHASQVFCPIMWTPFTVVYLVGQKTWLDDGPCRTGLMTTGLGDNKLDEMYLLLILPCQSPGPVATSKAIWPWGDNKGIFSKAVPGPFATTWTTARGQKILFPSVWFKTSLCFPYIRTS